MPRPPAAADQRGHDLLGRESLPGQLAGQPAQPGQLGAVAGQPQQRRGQRLRVAGRDQDGRIVQGPPLRAGCPRSRSRSPAAAPWNTLFGTTRSALSPVPKMPRQTWWLATSAGSSAAGTQSSQRTASLAAAAALVSASSWPLPIMVTSMGSPASRAEGGADDRGALQRGVQAVEHHPQRPGRVAQVGGPRRRVPRGRRADRTTTARARCRSGRAARCSSVSTTMMSAARSAAASIISQQGVARAAVQPPVPPGVAGADEVIEHHRRPAEKQPRQMHVEVAQIADQHHVGCGHPAGSPDQRQPPPPEPGQQGRRPPRLASMSDPGRGVQAERRVALRHLGPACPQALRDRGDPRVRRRCHRCRIGVRA